MPTTPTYSLRYPAPTDPADVPSDMHKLAQDVEAIPSLGSWHRVGPGTVQTDNAINVGGGGSFSSNVNISPGATLSYGFCFYPTGNVAGNRIVMGARIGEPQPFFMVDGTDGSISWGPGTSGVDTQLWRYAPGTLATAALFTTGDILARVGGASQVGIGAGNNLQPGGPASPAIVFGQAADTILHRYVAGVLNTPGSLYAGLGSAPGSNGLFVFANEAAGQPRIAILNQGYIQFGPGSGALDVNLYRGGAGLLRTDGQFWTSGQIFSLGSYIGANYGSAYQMLIGNVGPTAGAVISFGNAGNDAYIQRVGAYQLATNAALSVAGGAAGGGGLAPAMQAPQHDRGWVSAQSFVAIGEDVDGNANPAITLYRTSSGVGMSGNAFRLVHPSSVRGLAFQAGSTAPYGTEVYTTLLEIDLGGRRGSGPEGAQDTEPGATPRTLSRQAGIPGGRQRPRGWAASTSAAAATPTFSGSPATFSARSARSSPRARSAVGDSTRSAPATRNRAPTSATTASYSSGPVARRRPTPTSAARARAGRDHRQPAARPRRRARRR